MSRQLGKGGLELKKEISAMGDAINNPIVQKTIATATIGSGLTFTFQMIPYLLGIIATIVGILASWTILKKNKLEIKALIEAREEAESKKQKRQKEHLPLRREEDHGISDNG